VLKTSNLRPPTIDHLSSERVCSDWAIRLFR
jgi:hypothetical protein